MTPIKARPARAPTPGASAMRTTRSSGRSSRPSQISSTLTATRSAYGETAHSKAMSFGWRATWRPRVPSCWLPMVSCPCSRTSSSGSRSRLAQRENSPVPRPRLCRLLREEVAEQLGRGAPSLTNLATDWRKLLFPSATDEAFADGYAQAVTFGLLMARARDIALAGGLDRVARELRHTNIPDHQSTNGVGTLAPATSAARVESPAPRCSSSMSVPRAPPGGFKPRRRPVPAGSGSLVQPKTDTQSAAGTRSGTAGGVVLSPLAASASRSSFLRRAGSDGRRTHRPRRGRGARRPLRTAGRGRPRGGRRTVAAGIRPPTARTR